MKKLWKGISLVAMALSLTVVLAVAANAAVFQDMPAEHVWSYAALNEAVKNGLLKGNGNLIRPEERITRAETAAILNRAFGAEETSEVSFSDVPDSAWYHKDVDIAVHMKTFTGISEASFAPEQNITREQAFTVLARALKLENGSASDLERFTDAADVSPWAESAVAAMVKAGYVNGSEGMLNPGEYITRAEFAQMMYNTVKEYITEAGTYSAVSAGGNVLIRTSDVVLKSVTVAGDLIIGDGVGNGDVTLDHVTLEGRLVIRGGGVNSIKIVGGGTYKEIVVAKVDGSVRIYVDGAEVKTVNVADGKTDNSILLEGTFDSVLVSAENVTVIAQGKTVIDSVGIDGVGSKLIVSKDAQVKAVAITANRGTLEVSGNVESVTAKGDGIMVTVQSGGTIKAIAAGGAGLLVDGKGTVSSVVAESGSSGVVVNTQGTKITNHSSVDVKAGDKVIKPNPSEPGGGSSGGGGNVSNNYGAITKGKMGDYNILAFAEKDAVGIGAAAFDKETGAITAVVKAGVFSPNGTFSATISLKDVLGVENYDKTIDRTIDGYDGISIDLGKKLSGSRLQSIKISCGETVVTYSISRTNYDDGVVKLVATPDKLSEARAIWGKLVSAIYVAENVSAVSNGLHTEAQFNSEGEARFISGDTIALGSKRTTLDESIGVSVSGGAAYEDLNNILAFLKEPTVKRLVAAIFALENVTGNENLEIAVVISKE